MPRLKQIHIAGWKSIKDQTVDLSSLNLIVGANGAGKSNLLTVFQLINHNQATHPKARIKRVCCTYDENVAGPLLAGAIGLATLRRRCPHFGEWLTRLEQLDG